MNIELTEAELRLIIQMLDYDRRQLMPLDRELAPIVNKLEKALDDCTKAN